MVVVMGDRRVGVMFHLRDIPEMTQLLHLRDLRTGGV